MTGSDREQIQEYEADIAYWQASADFWKQHCRTYQQLHRLDLRLLSEPSIASIPTDSRGGQE